MELVVGKKTRQFPFNAVVRFRYRLLAALFIGSVAAAQSLTFELGRPVAAQDFRFKGAAFVFRTSGCADPAKLELHASAEGIVNSARRSAPVTIRESTVNHGVYAVQRDSEPGEWVVILKGSCGNLEAGAIVPVGPSGFVRNAAKFYPRAPAPAEIEAALKAFPEGGYK